MALSFICQMGNDSLLLHLGCRFSNMHFRGPFISVNVVNSDGKPSDDSTTAAPFPYLSSFKKRKCFFQNTGGDRAHAL